jgi:hypothetical protein
VAGASSIEARAESEACAFHIHIGIKPVNSMGIYTNGKDILIHCKKHVEISILFHYELAMAGYFTASWASIDQSLLIA